MNQENKTPHNFCETPEEKCTMNYCDENGCQNRKRHLVEENKQLPTAEEELMDAENTLFRHVSKVYNLSDVIDAMEEHTRLHTDPLREELEKLRAWKESAMKTLGVVDLQECGKLLNIGLGQSIADKIVPGIKELRAENEKLKKGSGLSWAQAFIDQEKKYENATFIAAKELVELEEQNQNLRETLDKIVEFTEGSTTKPGQHVNRIAKEALKGIDQ